MVNVLTQSIKSSWEFWKIAQVTREVAVWCQHSQVKSPLSRAQKTISSKLLYPQTMTLGTVWMWQNFIKAVINFRTIYYYLQILTDEMFAFEIKISYQYILFSIYTILYDASFRFYCCKFWNLVLDRELLKCCFYSFVVKRFWWAYVNSAIEVVILWRLSTFEYWLFYIEAHGMSHTIALIPFVSTIHQTTETMTLALKTIETATRMK